MFLMRRKIISTIIALTLCLCSAFASAPTNNLGADKSKTNEVSMTRISEEDLNTPRITLSEAQVQEQKNDSNSDVSTTSVNATISQDYYVQEISVSPLYYSPDDNNIYSPNPESINRTIRKVSDLQPRFESLVLSPDQTADFYNDIDASAEAAAEVDGRSYEFYGWNLTVKAVVQAQNPLYIKYTPNPEEDCFNPVGEQTLDIPYQSTIATINLMFKSSTDSRDTLQTYGLRGGFYFRYPSGPNAGQTGSMMVSPYFATNWE